jgi:hypothetical protein
MLLASFWMLQLIVTIVLVRSHMLHYYEMVVSLTLSSSFLFSENFLLKELFP